MYDIFLFLINYEFKNVLYKNLLTDIENILDLSVPTVTNLGM